MICPPAQRDQITVGVDPAAESRFHCLTRRSGLHVFSVRPHVLDRASGYPRQEVATELVDRQPLRAEIAADVGRLDDDAFDRDLRDGGQPLAQTERCLIGRDDVNAAVRIDPDERCARLDVRCEVARRKERVLKDSHRTSEPGVDVAAFDQILALDVGVLPRGPLAAAEEIPLRVLVDDRFRDDRLFGVKDRRQRVVADVDERGRGFGELPGFSRDGRDRIANETHRLVCQHGPVGEHLSETPLADLGRGQHRVHAGERARGRRIDRKNPGVRVRRAHERRPQHSLPVEIGGEGGAARDLLSAVDANLVNREPLEPGPKHSGSALL